MSLLRDFQRANRERQCPVCNRCDWCLIGRDDRGTAGIVLCQRVESKIRWREAGWLHRIGMREAKSRHRLSKHTITISPHDSRLFSLNLRFSNQLRRRHLEDLQRALSVPIEALKQLQTGWTGNRWSFPLLDESRNLIGIQTRTCRGEKRFLRGSKVGLFLPKDLGLNEMLLICEGASDTAAVLSLGLTAIGRASCTAGKSYLRSFLRKRPFSRVVIAADADVAGKAGALKLAKDLRGYCSDIRLIIPPRNIKDMRNWVRHGALRDDVLKTIEATRPLQ